MKPSHARLCHFVFIAAVALALPTAGAQTSFQEGVTPTVAYTHDATYIRSGDADSNFDADTDLELIVGSTIGDLLRSMLEFDLSEIPASDQADSVSLVLTTHSNTGLDQGGEDGNPTFDVYSYGFDIDESAATWNAPADGDATAGGTLGTLLASASFDVTVTGQAITFGDSPAFRSAVDDALAGDAVLRLIVVKRDESTVGTHEFARFAADSFATVADRPRLNVEHSPSGIGFAITEIDYSPLAATVTLTWTSRQSASYIAKYSLTMADGWIFDMADGITMAVDDEMPGDGNFLTKTFDLDGFGLAGSPELFLRIEEE
jgi:hypothetical protein